MAFPLDNRLVNITGKYGPRKVIYKNGRPISGGFHYGVDFAPEVKGTPLLCYAVADGRIESVGRKVDAGNFIILRRPNGDAWRYCHLSSIGVRAGAEVEDGDPIGRIGSTGNSTGVHLHLEVYSDRGLSKRHNPLPLIWYEWNPATKQTAPAPKPTTPPKQSTPKPKPAPAKPKPKVVRLGSVLRLRGYTAFQDSRLTRYLYRNGSRTWVTGDYTVRGIVGGNFKVRGPGGDAWVSGKAAAGLQEN